MNPQDPFDKKDHSEEVSAASRQAASAGLSFKFIDHKHQKITVEGKTFVIRRDLVDGPEAVVMVAYDGIVTLEGVHCELYQSARAAFYSALKPVPEVVRNVETVYQQHFVNRYTVGVHYRHHDAAQVNTTLPPFLSAHEITISSFSLLALCSCIFPYVLVMGAYLCRDLIDLTLVGFLSCETIRMPTHRQLSIQLTFFIIYIFCAFFLSLSILLYILHI